MPHLTPGTIIDNCKIISLIGEGGMGVVYLAEDSDLQRTVCIKFLKKTLLDNKDVVERFKRESRSLAKFNHNNIVKVYSYGVYENLPYFIMEYLDGSTLDKFIRKERRVNWELSLKIILQICYALQSINAKKIIHRDIKPSNIMLINNNIKVLDFGLAKISDESKISKTGSFLGSPCYMAPERWIGTSSSNISSKTDMFSVGVILYELISGINPFWAETSQEIYKNIVIKDIPAIPSSIQIPAEVDILIRKLVDKNIKHRFDTNECISYIITIFKKHNYNPDLLNIVDNISTCKTNIIEKAGTMKTTVLNVSKARIKNIFKWSNNALIFVLFLIFAISELILVFLNYVIDTIIMFYKK